MAQRELPENSEFAQKKDTISVGEENKTTKNKTAMKKITDEQKALIIKLKSICDYEDRNPIDKVDLNAFTISDASTLIKGLLGLQKCNHLAFRGVVVSNSYAFQCALDDVYDTIEKYQ